MAATPLTDVARRRLLANVDAEHGESMLDVPVMRYRDEERFQQELGRVFRMDSISDDFHRSDEPSRRRRSAKLQAPVGLGVSPAAIEKLRIGLLS